MESIINDSKSTREVYGSTVDQKTKSVSNIIVLCKYYRRGKEYLKGRNYQNDLIA